MRESFFVEQNKEKWENFEKELSKSTKSAEELRVQLIQVTDDLSYARTFYKNRSVRVYLNGLAQKIYINIYKNKSNFLNSLKTFFFHDVPLISYQSRKTIYISFFLLLITVLIGVFSSMKDENFARSILGNQYVEQTIDNIEKGDPMAIYKQSDRFEMFILIASNNLRVSLIVFIAGLFFSYGSIAIMIFNGIMLGVFMYFFYSRGIVSDFNYAVWLHGTIEILTLVIETTAGMLLGKALINPGTLSKSKAFSIWGKRGAMLFLATIPFILLAAFIESFLTRETGMSNWLRGLLILISVAIMLGYFVVYPFIKFRNNQDVFDGYHDLKEDKILEFSENKIYSNGHVFILSFQLFNKFLNFALRNTLFLSIIIISIFYFFYLNNSIRKFDILEINFIDLLQTFLGQSVDKFIDLYQNVKLFFNPNESIYMWIISSFWQIISVFISTYAIFNSKILNNQYLFKPSKFLIVLAPTLLLLNALLFFDSGFMTFIFLILFPISISTVFSFTTKLYDNSDFFTVFTYILRNGFRKLMGLTMMNLITTFCSFIFILSPFVFFFYYLININFQLSEVTFTLVTQTVLMFSFLFIIVLCTIIFVYQIIIASYSIKEIATAESINQQIDQIGIVSKKYGLETE